MKGNKLGNVICELRKAKGLKQAELAKELGISDKSISHWETGKNYPNIDMIYHISKYFKVSFYNLLEARMEDDNMDDELVKEIVNEFHDMKNKNKKILKIMLLITLIITVVLSVTILFSNSYNRFKVYQIGVENTSDFRSLKGMYVETKIKNTLILSNLKIRDLEIKNTDVVSLDLIIKENGEEKVLQTYSDLNTIDYNSNDGYFKVDKLSDYFDKLYLKVIIIDKDDNIHTYETKLKFVEDFSNNKIYYHNNENESLQALSRESKDIETLLLENGFIDEDYFLKKEDKKYTILFRKNLNCVNINYEENKFNYTINFKLNEQTFSVSVYNKNNIEIENYTYDLNNKKVTECNVGKCNDYNEIIKVLNQNFLNIIS